MTKAIIPSRRGLLSAAVAMPVIAAAGSSGAITDAHDPDAALLSAWKNYKDAWRMLDGQSADSTEAELEPFHEVKDRVAGQIEELPARTTAGIAIKLRYLLMAYNESRLMELAIIQNHSCDRDELDGDWRDKMLWCLIQDVDRMIAWGA
ncbi:hypothetical protein [Azospirillum sp. B4]|uniref:hypothetical protein n=1 Tax=Azospirillum sp. B4 TaxID=95605 RepID=UPI00034B46B4|nr:hypothetical protein [Azospirillum sp. B4]